MRIPGFFRQSRHRTHCATRGSGMVELLVASLLLAIGMMALVQVWTFAFRVTMNTDDKAIAYNLGRQAVERVKMSGFTGAAEGSTTTYYDGNQSLKSTTAGARYSVTVNVSSSPPIVNGALSATALRTVSVTVSVISPAQTIYQTTTSLVRAGI